MAAGDVTTIVVVAGSFLRPVGGWVSDRVGGYRLLVWLLGAAALCMGVVSSMPPVAVAVLVLGIAMGLLGMGNGALFQLVPQRFPERIGLATGIVGAAGGLGGFFLPTVLGAVKDAHRTLHRRPSGRGAHFPDWHGDSSGAWRGVVGSMDALRRQPVLACLHIEALFGRLSTIRQRKING